MAPNETIGHIETYLYKDINNFDSVNYIYVLDAGGTFVGVLSIKELFRKDKSTIVEKVMVRDLIKIAPETSPAMAAYLALKHSIKELPVVDQSGKLLGVVLSDDINKIVYRESREVLMRHAGVGHVDMNIEDVFKLPFHTSVLHRVPWLIFGLVGGLGSAKIIDFFSFTLERNLILASFIPLIVYMSGAVAVQIESFVIRDLAINPRMKFRKYFFKQLAIISSMAVICSALLYVAGLVMNLEKSVATTLSVALFSAILSSVFTGLFIPYIFNKLKTDPANASGPVATIIQDTISVVIYFTVATLLIP